MEFQLSYNLKCSFNFDDRDYFEFLWMYERLANQKHSENNSNNGIEKLIQGSNNGKSG